METVNNLKLFLTKRANRFLEKLDKVNKHDSEILKDAIDSIQINPFDSKKLKGELKGFNRVKRGNYRIIFHIDKKEKIISVIEIGERKNVYK
jgi:addiction module RelE/StbE family toxin